MEADKALPSVTERMGTLFPRQNLAVLLTLIVVVVVRSPSTSARSSSS